MLRNILSNIKVFFGTGISSLTENIEEYKRIIQTVNRTYLELSLHYPLPELDRRISFTQRDTARYFADYIPFSAPEASTLANVPYQILYDYTVSDIYGLDAIAPTSIFFINNCQYNTVMRKQYAQEHSYSSTKELVNQQILPFTSYRFYIPLSTWKVEITIDGKTVKSYTEATKPILSFTKAPYGTIEIDFRLQRVTVHSSHTKYNIIVSTASLSSPRMVVLDSKGWRLVGENLSQRSAFNVTYTQTQKPPLLFSEKDTLVNPDYQLPLEIYAIENHMTYSRDIFNSQLLQQINLKKEEQLKRLTELASRYRARRNRIQTVQILP